MLVGCGHGAALEQFDHIPRAERRAPPGHCQVAMSFALQNFNG
jgi:hypothetical protein